MLAEKIKNKLKLSGINREELNSCLDLLKCTIELQNFKSMLASTATSPVNNKALLPENCMEEEKGEMKLNIITNYILYNITGMIELLSLNPISEGLDLYKDEVYKNAFEKSLEGLICHFHREKRDIFSLSTSQREKYQKVTMTLLKKQFTLMKSLYYLDLVMDTASSNKYKPSEIIIEDIYEYSCKCLSTVEFPVTANFNSQNFTLIAKTLVSNLFALKAAFENCKTVMTGADKNRLRDRTDLIDTELDFIESSMKIPIFTQSHFKNFDIFHIAQNESYIIALDTWKKTALSEIPGITEYLTTEAAIFFFNLIYNQIHNQ